MKTRLIFSLAFLLACMSDISLADPNHQGEAQKIRVSMGALKAANIAMLRFKRDQPKINPKNFYVLIEETADTFEVDFVPNPVPIKEGYNGDTPYIEVQTGGANENGREIRYTVSKDGFRILKTLYSR